MITKYCPHCRLDLPLSDYSSHTSRKDGLQSICKRCQKTVNRNNYLKDKDGAGKRRTKARNSLASDLNDFKSKNGCIFCKENDACCLDFHHLLKAEKENDIAVFVRNGSRKKALNEIKKCIVICSNHHRKLHAGKITLEMADNQGLAP